MQKTVDAASPDTPGRNVLVHVILGVVGGHPAGESGDTDVARLNRLPRPARGQEWSDQAEVVPRPGSLPRTEANAGPDLSRVADLNPALLGCDAFVRFLPASVGSTGVCLSVGSACANLPKVDGRMADQFGDEYGASARGIFRFSLSRGVTKRIASKSMKPPPEQATTSEG
jgi:hypothetical protein